MYCIYFGVFFIIVVVKVVISFDGFFVLRVKYQFFIIFVWLDDNVFGEIFVFLKYDIFSDYNFFICGWIFQEMQFLIRILVYGMYELVYLCLEVRYWDGGYEYVFDLLLVLIYLCDMSDDFVV